MVQTDSKRKKKVFVGISGGVDSAVSAALLVRQGFDVTGVFIRIVLPGYPCPTIEDRQEAMRVAAHLRIPFCEIDLSKEYQKKVFQSSLAEFALGRTPNPDTLCNREIKFGLFFKYAMSREADFVATGHYAQIRKKKNSCELEKSADIQKDQSYFLYLVPEDHLAKSIFPIGHLQKSEVRTLAKKFGLPNALRKDSQGLCFLGNISVSDMLHKELSPMHGVVLSESGERVGTHEGVALYTLGQRHGFVVSGSTSTIQKPLYVIAKNLAANTLTVSELPYPKNKTKTQIFLRDVNWIGQVEVGVYEARFRYRQTLMPCEIIGTKGEVFVMLSVPQYIPEGQSLVVYRKNRCLGGGIV